MSYLKEKVSYLKGLADGMQINESTNEGKLLKAIIDVLDDVALAVEDVEEIQEQLSLQVDNIDEDLAEIERAIFDEEDEDECECGCGCEEEDDDDCMCFAEIECPHCNEKINIDEDMFDDDANSIKCPSCHKEIEIEWECGCEECEEDQE